MPTSDDIGGRGESIAYTRLTDYHGRQRPFFRPRFLGEKCPTFDYLVELINAGRGAPFFFVQVKATHKEYKAKGAARHLQVRVSKRDVMRMRGYPAPTYVVGINEETEEGFIMSVTGRKGRSIPSMPTTFPLDAGNLERLWDEVRSFWRSRSVHPHRSVFII